jgi:hypothetical protein
MEDEGLYQAYAGFYARFKDILKPEITHEGTTFKITRRRNSTR